jgi:hypothetical protein
MDESTRPNYYLLNRLNAADFNYTNLSYQVGNLCVQVLAVSNFNFPEVVDWAIIKQKTLLNARVLARANLCVLGLILAFIYLHDVWESTYQSMAAGRADLQIVFAFAQF